MHPKDADAVARLCGELGYPTTVAELEPRLARLLARDDVCLLVAESGGAVAGWIQVEQGLVLESEPWAEVGGLVVTEAMRGRGIGSALLSAGERWARERQMAVVRLRSNVVRSAAHDFYRKCGYEVFKTQLNFRKPLR